MLPTGGCKAERSAEPPAMVPKDARDAQDPVSPAMTTTNPTSPDPLGPGAGPSDLTRVLHSHLCVTRGAIGPGAAQGHIQIDDPKMRCVLAVPTPQVAELRFTYQGPTT